MPPPRPGILIAVSIALLAGFFLVMQALVLPPDGFFSGDQGSKYLQTRAFAEHGPLHPGIDVAAKDIDPDYRFQEPILRNRGGQLVSTFSWLLPMLDAPLVAAGGLRGVYVVPAIAVIGIFLGAAALGRAFGERTGLAAGWAAVLAAPALFYGLENWEHAPAAACALGVVLILMRDPGPLQAAAAGALALVAGLFREEAALVLPAFAAARMLVSDGSEERRRALRAGAWSVAGAAAAFALTIPGNLLVYRSPLPLHFTSEMEKTTAYWPARMAILHDIFLPAATPDSLWYTWPFVFALAALPFVRMDRATGKAVRYVSIGALLSAAGALAIIPSAGGAQWGPRYLFAAAPPLTAVASVPARGRGALGWSVRLILAAAVCVQVAGLHLLTISKVRHARLAGRLASLTAPGDVVITIVPWIPELAAPLSASRPMLFSWSPDDVPVMAGRALDRGITRVKLVTLVPQTGFDAPAVIDVPGALCRLVRGRQFELDDLGMTLSRYSCASP